MRRRMLLFAVLLAGCWWDKGTAPVELIGSPSMALISVTADSVFVSASWSAVSDPSGIMRYEWKDTTIGPAAFIGQVKVGQATLTVDTFGVAKPAINTRHDHEFKVRAVDGAANVGPYSVPRRWGIIHRDTVAPGAPTGIVLDTLIIISGAPRHHWPAMVYLGGTGQSGEVIDCCACELSIPAGWVRSACTQQWREYILLVLGPKRV